MSNLNISLPGIDPSKTLTISGQHCRIVPFGQAECNELFEQVVGTDELWRFLPIGPFDNKEDMYIATSSIAARPGFHITYGIVDTTSNKCVGTFSLLDIRTNMGVAEIGFVLFSPQMQKSRIGTEAMYLLTKYLFDDLKFRRVEWKCDNNNFKSKRAAERYGFTFEGIFRQHMVVKGRNRDTAWLAMLDNEWVVIGDAFQKWLNNSNFDASGHQLKSLESFRPV